MKKLTALILVTSLFACTNNKTDKAAGSVITGTTQAETDSLSYSYDSVKVYSKTKVSTNKLVTDTTKAVIVYPVFKDTAINKLIESRVISMAGEQKPYKNYEDLASGFIKEFDAYKATNSGSPQSWFEDMDLNVKTNHPNYLSILFTYVDYKGGAHPNTLFTYFNYNPRTYQTITLDSLITSDGMPKLRTVAERIFRKNEKLAQNASLSEGYFFAEGIFSLAETFTVTQEGLKFLYNPYEIKAYAAGTTELIVPFSEIKDIMKPSTILANFK